MCIQFTVEEETNNTVLRHKDHPSQGWFPNNQIEPMHVLRKSTHVDRYLDDTIFDPQGVAVAPPYSFKLTRSALMYQTKRRSMHACSMGPPQQWLSQKPIVVTDWHPSTPSPCNQTRSLPRPPWSSPTSRTYQNVWIQRILRPIPAQKRTGVIYRYPRETCPKVYTGQYGRTLKHCLKEHKRVLRSGEAAHSAVAE